MTAVILCKFGKQIREQTDLHTSRSPIYSFPAIPEPALTCHEERHGLSRMLRFGTTQTFSGEISFVPVIQVALFN
jgi:hypothetical protein